MTTAPGWSSICRSSEPRPPSPVGAFLSTAFTADSAAALPGPEWLRARRRQAAERFSAAALPTTSLEEWRYSRIDALDLDRYAPATDPGPEVPLPSLIDAVMDGATVVPTAGGFLAGVPGAGDPAVTVTPAPEGPARTPADAFALLNHAFGPEPLLVRVSPGAVARPVVLVHGGSSESSAFFPRVVVEAGESSEVTVLEVVTGRGLAVPVTEIDVAAGARVSYLQVQTLEDDAWQIALQSSRVARDASLVSAAVALGGDYARLRTDSALTGPGASARLLALYFGAGTQMHDFRTVQAHEAPKTQSDLLYKGVVANSARSVYSGLIRVEKGARGTNAFQTNRNLVLHEGAHADSVPNLEIEDNDVRCSHASAVGPVSEEQRFYLESRGVPPEVTDRLISLGFLAEVLAQLPLPALAPAIGLELAAKLARAEELEASRREAGVTSG